MLDTFGDSLQSEEEICLAGLGLGGGGTRDMETKLDILPVTCRKILGGISLNIGLAKQFGISCLLIGKFCFLVTVRTMYLVPPSPCCFILPCLAFCSGLICLALLL